MTRRGSFFVGSIECMRVSDGHNLYDPESVFSDVPPEEARAFFAPELDENGTIPIPYDCLLVRTGERLCLIDVGMGPIAEMSGATTSGHLLESLAAEGVSPADVDVVVLTHCHADHFGGSITMVDGKPELTFPNARYVMWRTEWEYWTAEENLAGLPEAFSEPARLCLPPIADAGVLELIEEEKEILPGISAIAAPGHTPGHIAVGIASGDEQAVYLADTVLHQSEFEHVDRVSTYETDWDQVRVTRQRLLGRSADEGHIVVAFHVGEPGRLSRAGRGFAFEPIPTRARSASRP